MTNYVSMKKIKDVRVMKIHTWVVSYNLKLDMVICVSSSNALGKNETVFAYSDKKIIGLYNGNDKKYAYVRDVKFHEFLKKYGLYAVRHEDPNQTYYEHEDSNGSINSIKTDGEKTNHFMNYDIYINYPTVENATWVIEDGVLYTRENIYTLNL